MSKENIHPRTIRQHIRRILIDHSDLLEELKLFDKFMGLTFSNIFVNMQREYFLVDWDEALVFAEIEIFSEIF